MATWHTIEGNWSGPRSPAGNWNQCQHREHTRSQKRIDEIRKLGSIRFDDGTMLWLDIRDGKHGQPRNGYGPLIADCLQRGVNSVAGLHKADN